MAYSYEELIIWQEARIIVKDIYVCLCNNKDFDFKSQIQRAAISIMNNIAEGFERNKNAEDSKQFKTFLNYSYGSCGEVRSMIYSAEDLGYINSDIAKDLQTRCYSLSCKIQSFINSLH